MIAFNKPPITGNEEQYIKKALLDTKLSGDGVFGHKCQQWFEKKLPCKKSLLTPSCTAALELSALLIDIQPGDEVIMPSYTFVSTANAFVLRGAKIIFIDIRPDTMNIDEDKIEKAITSKTKAIVVVHYAGVACEMDKIMNIAKDNNLYVVEDAAQAMMSSYKGKALGTIGHLGTFSFHETKNYTSGGEGGLLIINDETFLSRSEVIREKGTNRSQFFRGQVDKYTWIDVGSSYLPSELQAAFLWGQLEMANEIILKRSKFWKNYYDAFQNLDKRNLVRMPKIPDECNHNAHMFYLKLSNLNERTLFIEYLKSEKIIAPFHYIPLHSAPAGQKFSIFDGDDQFTTTESEKLVRLPLFYNMTEEMQSKVINKVLSFFK